MQSIYTKKLLKWKEIFIGYAILSDMLIVAIYNSHYSIIISVSDIWNLLRMMHFSRRSVLTQSIMMNVIMVVFQCISSACLFAMRNFVLIVVYIVEPSTLEQCKEVWFLQLKMVWSVHFLRVESMWKCIILTKANYE